MITQKYLNELSHLIIGAAIEVHKELGPGLLESIYERCLGHVLIEEGVLITSQQRVPLIFKGLDLECDLRFDLLVDNLIIVEVKAVERLMPIHEAQLLTYLKLLQKPKGILINFNSTNIFKEGQKTMVNQFYASLPSGY